MPLVNLYHRHHRRRHRQINVKIKCVLKLDINKRNSRKRGKEREGEKEKKWISEMCHVCASFWKCKYAGYVLAYDVLLRKRNAKKHYVQEFSLSLSLPLSFLFYPFRKFLFGRLTDRHAESTLHLGLWFFSWKPETTVQRKDDDGIMDACFFLTVHRKKSQMYSSLQRRQFRFWTLKIAHG